MAVDGATVAADHDEDCREACDSAHANRFSLSATNRNRMLRRVHETRVQLRWGDFDQLGHLTHVAYPVILDEGRDAFFRGTVGPFEDFPWVIAHLTLDHRGEIRHPAHEVVVRTRVA